VPQIVLPENVDMNFGVVRVKRTVVHKFILHNSGSVAVDMRLLLDDIVVPSRLSSLPSSSSDNNSNSTVEATGTSSERSDDTKDVTETVDTAEKGDDDDTYIDSKEAREKRERDQFNRALLESEHSGLKFPSIRTSDPKKPLKFSVFSVFPWAEVIEPRTKIEIEVTCTPSTISKENQCRIVVAPGLVNQLGHFTPVDSRIGTLKCRGNTLAWSLAFVCTLLSHSLCSFDYSFFNLMRVIQAEVPLLMLILT